MNNILCNLENQNSEVIICGDFNIDLLKVNNKKTTTDFYDMMTSSGFFPKITLPTRITYHSSTLIDNIFCKLSSRLINSRAGIVDTHISDHLPIFICIENLICKEGVHKYVKQINNNVNDQIKFKHALASQNILKHLEKNLDNDPNINYAKVEEILTRVKEETMPSKLVRFNKYKHKKSDWITNGILKSIKYKDNLYKKIKKLPADSIQLNEASINLKTYDTILRRMIRLAKRDYYFKQFNKFNGNIKETWSTLGGLLGKKNKNKSFCRSFAW